MSGYPEKFGYPDIFTVLTKEGTVMNKAQYRNIEKKAESALKFLLDVYCRATILTLLVYYIVYVVDALTLQAVKTEQQSMLVWGVSYLVSFVVVSLYKSAERKINAPDANRRVVTTGEILAHYFLEYLGYELTYFIFVVFSALFLEELFPYSIIVENTSGAMEFISCAAITLLTQIVGIMIAIRSKNRKSSYAPWYKLGLLAGVTLVFFILFVPSYHGAEPRNMPLFYACVWGAVLYLFIRFIIRASRLSKYANKLKLRKARDVKCNYFKRRGTPDISYTMKGERINVVFLYRIEKQARHYFEDCQTIRRFFRMGVAARGLASGRMSSISRWTEISEIRLPWREIKENEKYIVVWKRFPTEIADENSRSSSLGNNDVAAGKILILNIDSFNSFIQK